MNSRATKISLTIPIQDTSHILVHKEFIFCLVCQRGVNCANGVSQHMLDPEHEDNVQNLFKICMQDPFCDTSDPMFADLLKNSVINISHKSSCDISNIYQIDTDFSCLVCPKTASSADIDYVKSHLVLELKVMRDLHFDCMISNYSWIYCQNKNSTFMMFYKSVTFCSVCKQVIHCDSCDLNANIKHVESSQHKEKLNSMLSPSNALDKLKLTSTNESESNDAQDLGLVEVFKISPCNDGQSDASNNETSNSETNGKQLDGMLLQDPLTCPVCGEVIEIFNDNADFSLLHHSQKHIDLSDVNTDFDCEYDEDTDYVCPVCLETIPMFNKNLELSITCHFNEKRHDRGIGSSEMYNESGFLVTALYKLSQEHRVHSSFFRLERNRIFCKLCSCFLQDSGNNENFDIELLTKHISGLCHSDQYNTSFQKMTLTVVNYNKDIVTGSTPNSGSLLERLANKNVIVHNNKDFIEVNKFLYSCKICQKHICYSPNESTLERNFLLHFNLPRHKNNLKKKERKQTSIMTSACVQIRKGQVQGKLTNVFASKRICQEVLLKMAENPDLSDVKYIEYRSGKFFCIICKVTMTVSTCGSPVKDHILGLKHNKEKNKVASDRAQYILKKAVKYSNIVSENLHYVDTLNGDYFCTICKVLLLENSSLSHLKKHLYSNSHRSKVFRAVGHNTSKH